MNHDPLCKVPALLKRGKTVSVLSCDCTLIVRVREDERSAALRDAVKAVKLSCSADIELVERIEVIAAIEALGGER